MSNEFRQDQSQDVNFDTKPVWKVRCHHFINPMIEKYESDLNAIQAGHPRVPIVAKEIEREQQVDVLVSQGKVVKVFCHFYNAGTCKSPKNHGNQCHLEYSK